MKPSLQQGCGSIAPNSEPSPAKEVLEEQGEIFSCGGVYLSTARPLSRKAGGAKFLHLPNRNREVLTILGSKVQRRGQTVSEWDEESLSDVGTSTDVLRRLSKESLN